MVRSITDLHLPHREVKPHNMAEEGSATEVTETHTAVSHMWGHSYKHKAATKSTGRTCMSFI